MTPTFSRFHLNDAFFEQKLEETLDILETYHNNIENAIALSPPLTIVELSQVGYYEFRQATLIEPFWNAYFLGLVISIAQDIENIRLKEDEKMYSHIAINGNF